MGNYFLTRKGGYGEYGEKMFVHLVDTPYYADGPKSEPICYKDRLVTSLEELGFRLELWEGLTGNPISEFYSKFIFVIRDDSVFSIDRHQLDDTFHDP
jgi:hypothetical protein